MRLNDWESGQRTPTFPPLSGKMNGRRKGKGTTTATYITLKLVSDDDFEWGGGGSTRDDIIIAKVFTSMLSFILITVRSIALLKCGCMIVDLKKIYG